MSFEINVTYDLLALLLLAGLCVKHGQRAREIRRLTELDNGLSLEYPRSTIPTGLQLSDIYRKTRGQHIVFPLIAYFALLTMFVIGLAQAQKIHLLDLVVATTLYAAIIFVGISEALLLGFAKLLTRWRGEKWVKELDYVYLSLGAAGLVISMSKLDIVEDKMTASDFIGPFTLATALIIRAIKIRSEINQWNKA